MLFACKSSSTLAGSSGIPAIGCSGATATSGGSATGAAGGACRGASSPGSAIGTTTRLTWLRRVVKDVYRELVVI